MEKRILVMDDDSSILDVIEEALSYENYKVKSIGGSTTALKVVSDYKPDLILLDYLVNDVNGGEICHQIKCNPHTQHIPVIIMSGYPRVFESLGDYGCNSFISKPFSLTELLNTISRLSA